MASPTSTAASTESHLKCTACGAENEPGSKYCLTCGSALILPDSVPSSEDAQPAVVDLTVVPASSVSSELGALVKVEINEVQERLLDRIATLDKQVADLQMDQVKNNKRWFQNPSVLIALSAFLLSLTATTFSWLQTQAREKRDARVELRGLIQRLSEIPRESATLSQVYTDTNVIASLGGLLQQENAVLAKQARDVMAIIPDQVTSGEYILVASSLANSNLVDDAIEMYKKAEAVLLDYNDAVSLYRSEGQLLFFTGKPEEGRKYFQNAEDIFNTFPSNSEFVQMSVGIETQMYWGYVEYSIGECAKAREHTADARARYNAMVDKYPTARTNQSIYDSQIKNLELATRLCRPAPKT